MALETATYLPDLVPANPAHTDPQAQGDAHLRLIKQVLKNTFPNFTDVALNSTQSAIDAAVAAVTGGTVSVGAGSATAPSLAVGTGASHPPGLHSPSTDHIAIATAGVDAIVVNSDQTTNFAANMAVAGAISATGKVVGTNSLPIGAPLMWLTNTAPSGWLFANGQQVSRTTYANLFAVFGTFFGAGDGSTTFNLPNMCEVVPVGQRGMGGAASRGLVANSNLGSLGGLAGEENHLLVIGEIPTHTPSGTIGGSASAPTLTTGANFSYQGGPNSQPTVTASSDTINGSSFTFSGNPVGGGLSHNNLQPSVAVNWIVYAGL